MWKMRLTTAEGKPPLEGLKEARERTALHCKGLEYVAFANVVIIDADDKPVGDQRHHKTKGYATKYRRPLPSPA